jgi:KUP system potassium uptake protein
MSEILASPSSSEDPPNEDQRPVSHRGAVSLRKAAQLGLVVGALGVVFGDIGTSPLYALQTVFSIDHSAVHTSRGDVFGVISLVFWSITLIVSVKYLSFIMRADNDGEGGIMALTALVQRAWGTAGSRTATFMTLGVLGASLFYGDSVITPAISVLSAVEGLKIAAPSLGHLVLPISLTLLVGLFLIQRWGTHRVGGLFGPVMVLWFAVIAVAGLHQVIIDPSILEALSPSYGASFVFAHPYVTFIAMGAIVLAITGAEALYADMGHFGRVPIRRAWFALVFPALTLNYLGQGSLILRSPSAIANPFFLLVPSWARIPMVVLAAAATIIASQAVISGAFSVSRQAMQLGFLPRLTIRHTAEREIGQIYVPAVNWSLFVAVVIVTLEFGSAARLATAYGVAVTGTFVVNTILFLAVARALWHWQTWKLALAGAVFLSVEITFFAANLTKIVHGGWLPLTIALATFTVMTTWQRGREIVTANRAAKEGSLQKFVDELHHAKLPRVKGTAVFPHPSNDTTPFALRANVEHNHVLHENVVIISAKSENVPHIPITETLSFNDLGYTGDGIIHLSARFGFQDLPNLPKALHLACANDPKLKRELDLDHASYFLSRITIRATDAPGMSRWRKRLFLALARNAASPTEYFGLPDERTILMGTQIDV